MLPLAPPVDPHQVTPAWEGLAQQKKLQEDLQKRADELRESQARGGARN